MIKQRQITRRLIVQSLAVGPFAAVTARLYGCGGGAREITITAGDTPAFDLTEIKAKANEELTITLRHTGSFPVASMGHNFVLLKQGVDAQAFAEVAAKATTSGYIPADRQSDVLAHTKLLGGGESDSVTFRAPSPGRYKFLCTFPGHYLTMMGDFVVS